MNRPKHFLEIRYIGLAALIQLVNALDFMMIMPLGPDLSHALGISPNHIGYLGGGYTLAAAVSSLICAKFIDRFDRKKVALIAMLGLSITTALCTFSWNMPSLFLARLMAGVFAGPATSIALAIVADAVPTEKRGRAMALVMGAFSIAAIIGVPFGLALSLRFSWNSPFYVVSGLGLVTLLAIFMLLPNMVDHLQQAHQQHRVFSFKKMTKRSIVINAFSTMGIAIFSTFLIVPNVATYFQFNLGVPREELSFYYVVGGIFSLLAMQLGGRLTDQLGAMKITLIIGAFIIVTIADGFLHQPFMPPIIIFSLFMALTAIRTIAAATVNSQVPEPWERAGFMSLQSVCQHIFSGLAAVLSSLILTNEGNHLGNVAELGGLAILLTLVQPLFLNNLLNNLHRRKKLNLNTN